MKKRLATAWLDGCSGCHMSLLDLDERLLQIAEEADVVYSPLVDAKEIPKEVDVALVEGAVGTDHDEARLRKLRSAARCLVALGDCAVTGNVSAMRNLLGRRAVLEGVYGRPEGPGEGRGGVHLREVVEPLHHVVDVDVVVPGCPPSPDAIFAVLKSLLENESPLRESMDSEAPSARGRGPGSKAENPTTQNLDFEGRER